MTCIECGGLTYLAKANYPWHYKILICSECDARYSVPDESTHTDAEKVAPDSKPEHKGTLGSEE
jgi:hypothetical protein